MKIDLASVAIAHVQRTQIVFGAAALSQLMKTVSVAAVPPMRIPFVSVMKAHAAEMLPIHHTIQESQGEISK